MCFFVYVEKICKRLYNKNGDNMKKMFSLLIILFIAYFILQYIFTIFGYNHNINYDILTDGNVYEIKEILTYNNKQEQKNYYFEIKYNGNSFPIQIFNTLNKGERVIIEIKSIVTEDYTCIFPIFIDGNILTDVLCQKQEVVYNYQNIKNKSAAIDEFVNNLDKYKSENYTDKLTNTIDTEFMKIYKDNIEKDYYYLMDDYKGINIIGSNLENNINEIKLFGKDVYAKDISIPLNGYYIIADYNSEYKFTRINIIGIKTGKIRSLKTPKEISYDAYFQGTYGNYAYLIDKENSVQYEIDPQNSKIKEIGNINKDAKNLVNGQMITTKINEIIKENKKFNIYEMTSENELKTEEYVKIDEVKKINYLYLYKQNGTKYEVYRASVQNPKIITYLFETNRIDDIKYEHDSIFYSEGTNIKYYNDHSGTRTIITNTEYSFNNKMFFWIYK